MTEDNIRSEIASLRAAMENGLAAIRTDVSAGRQEAAAAHQRHREELTDRLRDAVEAEVRIEILEENQKALVESRRFMWVQVIAASGVVATIVGLIIAYRVHP